MKESGSKGHERPGRPGQGQKVIGEAFRDQTLYIKGLGSKCYRRQGQGQKEDEVRVKL